MGVMRGSTLVDRRGREFVANVADCVNIDRTPKVRERILDGEFHRLEDPAGGDPVTVEKTFFYTDFGRGQFFLVLPRWDRHRWKAVSRDLREVLTYFPASLAPLERGTVRVVFGMAELREKLLAYDADLNDRLIEVLKVLLLYQHPFLEQHPRLTLTLERADAAEVEFIACYDHHPERYRLGCSRSLVDDLFAREKELRDWIAAVQTPISIDEDGDPLWINLQRWSEDLWAIAHLDECAAQIEAGNFEEAHIDSDEFDRMLDHLPRGNALSAAAKADIETLRRWVGERRRTRHRGESLKEELWEIRHNKEVKGKPALRTPELMDQLWTIVSQVSESDFEANCFVDEFRLGVPGGGSWYDPRTANIGINRSSLPGRTPYDPRWLEQVVLHEVGHAVHARNQKRVDEWLRKHFGWEQLARSVEGINHWIIEMGGYPPATDEVAQGQIRACVRSSVGNGWRWTAPARPKIPVGHPWRNESLRPRLACEATSQRERGKRWYDFSEQWYRYGGRRFFVNYYYGELMIVSEDALEYVRNGALEPYALMAPAEFFAELYMTVHAKAPARVERAAKLDSLLVEFLRTLGSEAASDGGEKAEAVRRPVGSPYDSLRIGRDRRT